VHYDVASRGLEPRHHDLHPCALPVELRSQALREQESNLRCRGPKPRRPCQQTIPECVRAGGFEPPTGSVSENCSHQTELHARELHQRGPGRSRTDYLSRARGARYQVRHKPKTPAGGDRGYCLLRAGDRNRTGVASLEDWGSAIELHPRGVARLRPGSNRRPSARQADALPLSYEAKIVVRALGRSRTCTLRRRKPPPSPLGHEGRSCWGECDRRELNPRGPNGPTRVTAWRDEPTVASITVPSEGVEPTTHRV